MLEIICIRIRAVSMFVSYQCPYQSVCATYDGSVRSNFQKTLLCLVFVGLPPLLFGPLYSFLSLLSSENSSAFLFITAFGSKHIWKTKTTCCVCNIKHTLIRSFLHSHSSPFVSAMADGHLFNNITLGGRGGTVISLKLFFFFSLTFVSLFFPKP